MHCVPFFFPSKSCRRLQDDYCVIEGVQQTTNPKVSKTRPPCAHGMMHWLMLASLLPALVAGEYDNCGRPDAVYASWDQVTRSLRAHHHAHAPNAHRQPCRVDRGTARLTLPALFRAALTSTSSAARALRPLTHRSNPNPNSHPNTCASP